MNPNYFIQTKNDSNNTKVNLRCLLVIQCSIIGFRNGIAELKSLKICLLLSINNCNLASIMATHLRNRKK